MAKSMRIALLAFMVLAGLTVSASPQAGAILGSEVSPEADVIWDVATPDPGVRHTGPVRALVRDLVEYNGRMYVAGKFLDVLAPDGTTFSQPYLAAFDLDTGVWIDTFRPQVDGMIYALEITADGRLYAAGELTGGVALYDANTGARNNAFSPGVENSWGPPAVFDIELVGSQLYAGGTFTLAQGTVLRDLARFDAATGTLDTSWIPTTDFDSVTPRLGGRNIFGIAVDAARDRVYLAGKFGGINGNMDAAYFATLNTTDGSLRADVPQGLPAGVTNHRNSFSMWMHDVQFRGDSVYIGGQGHQTTILDATTLLPRRTFFANRGVGDLGTGGDTQVIHLGENTIWSGCHCWGSVGEYELFSYNAEPDGVQLYAEYQQWFTDFATINPFGQQPVKGGYGIDINTESLVPLTFGVQGQAGAYAIYEDSNGRVWFGGEYSRDTINDRPLSGIARFSPAGAVGPVPPEGFVSTLQTQERIVLNWQPVDGASSYEVSRNGAVISNRSSRWQTDRGLAAGTTYTYTVRAQYPDGSFGPATAALEVTTEGQAGPVAPQNLRSTLQTRDRIVLTWDPLDGAVSYEVSRNGAPVANQASRWLTDRDVTAGTAYRYSVRAQYADGSFSQASATVTVSTEGAPDPVAPDGFISTLQTRDRIVLNWQPVDGASSYEVSRDGVAISNRASRWQTDQEVVAGTSYAYTVRVQYADGSFGPSTDPLAVSTLP